MKDKTKRALGIAGLLVGAAGALGAFFLRKKKGVKDRKEGGARDVWARPGMKVTFRAELMPGRDRAQRTFVVERLLPNGRVTLHDFSGQHTEREFEHLT